MNDGLLAAVLTASVRRSIAERRSLVPRSKPTIA
jgi:hypothetical protein